MTSVANTASSGRLAFCAMSCMVRVATTPPDRMGAPTRAKPRSMISWPMKNTAAEMAMQATAEMMTVRHWAPKSRSLMVVPRCTSSMVTSRPAMLSRVESANMVVGNMPIQKPARNTTEATSSMDTMAFVLAEIISPTANTTKMTAAEIIAVMIFFSFDFEKWVGR